MIQQARRKILRIIFWLLHCGLQTRFFLSPEKGSKMMVFGEENESEF